MTKKLLLLFAALLVGLSSWAHNFKVDGIYYNITSSTDLTVSVTYEGSYYSYSNEYSGSVVIPSTVTYNSKTYTVTSIGYEAFRDCTDLTSVTIPSSVTSIGSGAFSGCNKLQYNEYDNALYLGNAENPYLCLIKAKNTSIASCDINENTKVIFSSAFYKCTSLTSVTIPNSVTSIGSSAFSDCTSLTSVTIPNTVTSIDWYAFEDCTNLTSVTIPSSVTSIGNYAFDNCTSLKNIVIEDGSETLSLGYNSFSYNTGQGLFYDCPLESIYLGRNISYESSCQSQYGYSPFYEKSELTDLTISEHVTSIGNYAFSGCSSLTAVTIPEGVTSIGSSAFKGSGLISVTIPSSVTSIGESAFYDVKKAIFLTNTKPTIGDYAFNNCAVYYTANNDIYNLNGSKSYSGVQKVYSLLSSMFVVDGVKYIPTSMKDRACDMVDVDYSATSVNSAIGPTVKYTNSSGRQYDLKVNNVNMYAAYGCKALSDLSLKNTGPVGAYAFYGSNASSISVVNTVTTIGDYAFYGCESATTIDVSNDGDLGAYSFASCTSAESIKVSNNGQIGVKAFSGCTSNAAKATIKVTNDGNIGNYAFENCKSAKSITVSNNGSVGECAFSGCTSNVTDATINVSNEGDIKNNAFENCTSATSIIVSNNGSVGVKAFYGCTTNAAKAKINVSNEGDINNNAFANCASATLIEVSNSGTIGASAFENCMTKTDGIISISHKGNIGSSAFKGCSKAISIGIKNEGPLGESAFYGCSGAKTITLGDEVTSIGNNCFYDCSSVENMVLTSKVESIGSSSFKNCSSMTSIEFNHLITTISANAFSGCSSLASLSIPANVASIASGAFDYCTSIGDLTFEDTKTAIALACKFVSGKNIYFGRDFTYSMSQSSPFSGNKIIEKITTNKNVTNLGTYAFSGCSGINEVILGDNITSIGEYGFIGCSSIENVKLGRKTLSIGDYCFSNCSGLVDIDFNDALNSIGKYAFSGCSKLASLTLHPNVDKLLIGTFDGCTSIIDMTFEDTDDAIDIACVFVSGQNLYLGRNVTYNMDNSSPFNGDSYLERVTTSMNVNNIPDYLFYNCKKLNYVYLSDAVKTVGTYAFSGDVALKTFEVGMDIESIGAEAFSDCTALLDFTSHSIAPAAVGTEALDDIDKFECTLHIPEGTEDAYMAADQWKEFWAEDDQPTRYKVMVSVDPACKDMGTVKGANGYNANTVATLEAKPKLCHVFVEWSDGNTDNPRTITVTENVTLTAKFAYGYYIASNPTANNIAVELNEDLEGVEYQWYVSETAGKSGRDITNDLQSTGSYAWTKTNGVWTSGNKGVNSSSSTLSMDITAKAGDKLSFDYAVSSESGYDFLTVYIGNTQIGDSYSGTSNGNYEYTFTADMNTTLKFVYSKDSSSASGSDQATISNVKINTTALPVLLETETSSSVDPSVLEIGKYYYCEVSMPDGTVLTSDQVLYEGAMETGVEEINVERPAIQGIYDILGRNLSAPQRGINIINGKKVILK